MSANGLEVFDKTIHTTNSATAKLAVRRIAQNVEVLRAMIETCASTCESCAAECERHEHGHCRLCAEMCRECAADCRAALPTIQ